MSIEAASPDLAANEETLALPQTWLRHLHPRRGGTPVAAPTITESAVAEAQRYVEERAAGLDAKILSKHGDGDVIAAARRHLRGEADPLGAAAVAKTIADTERDRIAVLTTFLDAWVLEHGPAFAACAIVELDSLKGFYLRQDADFALEVSEPVRRMRAILAAAGDEAYAEAVRRLGGHRGDAQRRLVVSYLVPTEHDWVADSCREHTALHAGWESPIALFHALGDRHHLTLLGAEAVLGWGACTVSLLATMADGLGGDLLTMLERTLIRDFLESAGRKRIFETAAVLPTDDAFRFLMGRADQKYVQGALIDAMNRYPVRAVRLLPSWIRNGPAKIKPIAAELLTGHLLAHPQAVETALAASPGLIDEDRAVVESLRTATVRQPEATPDDLPALLVAPPWTRKRKTAKPAVLDLPAAPYERAMQWAEGEREEWALHATPPWGSRYPDGTDWADVLRAYRAGKLPAYGVPHLLAQGPAELVRPLLASWKGLGYWYGEQVPWLRALVTKYAFDALPLVLKVARDQPTSSATLLLPYLDPEVAESMTGWLARSKVVRPTAIEWFHRHGVRAARQLFPAALGKPGQARREAGAALRLIAARTGAEVIVEAARDQGADAAAEAVATLLATDPLDVLPARAPKVPTWVDQVRLPQVLLRDRRMALPDDAAGHLITMLAMSKPGEVYAGIDIVRDACDQESLAAFSWALFLQWERCGAPSRDGWAMSQLAWLGDDDTVRRITPLIRSWPGEGSHKRAVSALEVLAGIGTDVALMHLHGIAQKVKSKPVKTGAERTLGRVAADRGLSRRQLADRLVPDFGLDADGTMTLDYGPRRFVVGFDEQLKPQVTADDGKRLKALPKPGVKDDPDLAPTAYKRFAVLKKDVRTVASDQVRRLESAMVERRRWSTAEFRTLLLGHPLVWHIAKRLVWLCEDGGKTTAFRPAEDRTLADVEDDLLTLPESATIGIAHPIDLTGDPSGDQESGHGGALAAWSELLADYEILQPFPQLGREVHRLTEAERNSTRLERFEKVKVPATAVLGLVRRGWERGAPQDAGGERWISRAIPGGRYVIIGLDPGISVGYVAESGEQTLEDIWIGDRPYDFRPSGEHPYTFGELDPVTASEVLADLTALARSAVST